MRALYNETGINALTKLRRSPIFPTATCGAMLGPHESIICALEKAEQNATHKAGSSWSCPSQSGHFGSHKSQKEEAPCTPLTPMTNLSAKELNQE